MFSHWKKIALWIGMMALLIIGTALIRPSLIQVPRSIGDTSTIEGMMALIRPAQLPPSSHILLGILVILIMPPLPIIHQWLLAQVYRYAFQPGEQREWENLSTIMTGIVMTGVGIGMIVWVADPGIPFNAIVAGLSLVSVVAGAGGALWIANKRQFSERFTSFLVIAAGLVSLLVPFGILGVYSTWPFVLAGIVAYIQFRREAEFRLERNYEGVTRWQIDSLVFGIMALLSVLCFIVLPVSLFAFYWFGQTFNICLPIFILVIPSIILFSQAAARLTRFHIRDFAVKKKTNAFSAAVFNMPERYSWNWLSATTLWAVSSLIAAALVFAGQSIAYTYFLVILR